MISRHRLGTARGVAWAFALLVLISGFWGRRPVTGASLTTANVMAPLHVKDGDWAAFEHQLDTVRNYGVDAVSVDVWWGDVEGRGDNAFNWSYYDTIFSKIKAHGLKIVPILSFHRCGGNVNDACDIPLPSWLWTKYVGKTFDGIQINATDLQYKSEQGHFSRETIQLWADPLVLNEYADLVNAFKSHFSSYEGDFIEINVSAGPSGELRYPSYNNHDSNTGYPTRGALQCYSTLAVQDFRNEMLAKYGSLAGVNGAWGTNLNSISEIRPPSNADFFFSSGDYRSTRYGRDFVDWYDQSLVNHGKTLIGEVIDALGGSFQSAKIGYKIPGVHWTMGHPTYPRAAEVAAGLIRTSSDFNSEASGHGYSSIVGLAKTLSSSGRDIVLHFTCLEMDDQNVVPQYSLAKTLVFWVAREAERQGVTIKGENALNDGLTGDPAWDNIDNAFRWASYSGFTTLRIGDVASAGIGQARYDAFIKKFRPASTAFPSLYVRGTHNNWGTTAMTGNGTIWSLNNVVFSNAGGDRFKFDVYGDWRRNCGGSGLSGQAVPNGSDIAVVDRGVYSITFDESSKSYWLVRTGDLPDAWYFRGTPNAWGTLAMNPADGGNVFQAAVTFAKEDPNPRLKIDHFGDWKENYPDGDLPVDDCARYEISFNVERKTIGVRKLEDVTTGACASATAAPSATRIIRPRHSPTCGIDVCGRPGTEHQLCVGPRQSEFAGQDIGMGP